MLARIPSDIYAALLLIALGVFTIAAGTVYPVGSLTHMGPGFYPRAIGVLLIVCGIAVAFGARSAAAHVLRPSAEEIRGWVCILGGIAAFAVLGAHAGLIPATFAIVFISALGSKNNSVKDAALLALGMTVVGVVIFGLILKIQMPLIGWR